jgi:photosystem II stability/assembly factor-like uncharacterized protein
VGIVEKGMRVGMFSSITVRDKRAALQKSVLWITALVIASGATMARAQERATAEELRQSLYSTCFTSDKEGWAVGDLARIFHTTDGAQTWERQDAGTKKPFVAISCLDRNHLWIAGQAGQIAHSIDAGKSWQMQPSGTERQLLELAFANADRGLAVGDFGTIRRTVDGGKSWSEVKLPQDTRLPEDVAEIVQPGDVVIYGVAFPDPDHVWIAGEFGVILNSTDGGETFHPQVSPVDSSLFGIYFTDAQHGWAVGLEETLLATTDGGITWTKQQVESPKGFTLALYDVAVRGNVGWAVGNSGILLYSGDAGVSWKLMDVPVKLRSGWFRGLSLLPDGRGFVVGARGMVVALDADTYTPLKQNY